VQQGPVARIGNSSYAQTHRHGTSRQRV